MASDDDAWLQWHIGRAGWVRFDASDWAGPLYVRFVEAGGRLSPVELYVDTRGAGLRSSDLRQLDLTRLTALVAPDWETYGRERSTEKGADLSRLASHYATRFGRRARHWVADSMRAQVEGSGVTQVPPAPGPPASEAARVGRGDQPRTRLMPVMGRVQLTDEFLREVAAAYDDAVRRGGRRPLRELAAQADVSWKTVQAWVAKARQRGLMRPGEQGKVG